MSGEGFGPSEPQPQPQPAAGWYPDATGVQRYWDGAQWTAHTAPSGAQPPQGLAASGGIDDKTWALIAHLSPILIGLLSGGFLAIVGPLVVWLIKKDESSFVDQHAREALNFQITLLLAGLVLFVLFFTVVLIPVVILLGFVLFIVGVVFAILAAIAAGNGQEYRYPVAIRFVR